MKKTKSLFYEMRMRKTHVIVVYVRTQTLHDADVLSLVASILVCFSHFSLHAASGVAQRRLFEGGRLLNSMNKITEC